MLTSTLASLRPGWCWGLRPDEPLTVTEWADRHRVLSQRNAAEAGKWRTERTPYLQAIMNDLSADSDVERVTMMKGAQIGGTECGNNWIGYIISHAPGPAMVVQPTVDLGKRWSRQRLAAMIEDMDILRQSVKESRARDSGNTVLSKEFQGGIVVVAGANSAAGLRSMPVKYLMLDEVDAYPHDVDGEGDPVELAINRTKTFSRRKIIEISTPTTKGISRIEKSYQAGDQREFQVPCPHCGERQTLLMKNLHWQKDEAGGHLPETVQLVCIHNGCLIDEYHKTAMLAAGEWVVMGAPNAKHHSYQISSLYSPLGWQSWAEIVHKFLEAKNDASLLKTFTNTTEGMPFEELGDKIDLNELQYRAEDYPVRECPKGVLILTAGVDTQPDRFEITTWGHGVNQHLWAIDYHVIWGSPSLVETRQQLDEYLAASFPHAAGCELTIQATGIDSGGHNTQDIYDYCRHRKSRRILATKGYSVAGRPIIGKPSKVDVTVHGKTVKNGADLWMVGSDTAKSLIYNRLTNDKPALAGYVHFSKYLPDAFYKQLTAEKLSTRYVKGHPKLEWILPAGRRNEVLDCTVGAVAAAYYLGLHRWRPAQWRALEERVQPATPDLFAADSAETEASTPEPPPPIKKKSIKKRRRAGRNSFVHGGMNGG
ncbi:phage terminase large subunit family protein [uncultured Paraglaciecola sp.]|uniref:phage terminase large subunit family protein n=1 Tax=uncultured Paraglaciecola sp. TaxID=1765024 RepID=UPI0026049CD3|nr:phage terminase large subunit family protein [uncultured Paraglaciecola sp.]